MRIYSELVESCEECPAFMEDNFGVNVHGCCLIPNAEIISTKQFPDFCPCPEDPEYPDTVE